MKKNNGARGNNRPNSRNGNPGIHHVDDNFNHRRIGRWQPIVRFISITADKATVSEGGVVVFTVNVEGLPDGSTIYWTTQSLNGTITTADFTDNIVQGSATVAAETATITRGILFDGTAEAGDAFRILIRTDSVTGPVVLGSALVEIIQSTVTVQPNQLQPYAASEGDTITWSVSTTFIENGTVLYYTIANSSTADFTTDANSGSFTINNSAGSFSLTIRRDSLTEGTENFTAQVRQGSTGGSVIATSLPVPIADISQTPVISVVANTINEGSTAVFNISTTGVTNGTSLYWTVESSTMTAVDFSTAMSGTVVINNNAGTVNITTIADRLSEPIYAGLLLDGTGLNGSILLNGSGQYLTAPANAAFSFGAGDFTVELWFNSTATLQYSSLISVEDNSTGWTILLNTPASDGKIIVYDSTGLGAPVNISSTGGYNDGKWHHVAWVRIGTNCSLYIDGVNTSSSTVAGSTSDASLHMMRIGSSYFASRDFNGAISSLRIVKGVGVYTAAFTRPALRLPNTSATVLLMNFIDGGSYLDDDSLVGSTITAVGSPSWTALSPLLTDNSSYQYPLTRPNGTAQISTTLSKYGTSSLRFNGDGVIRTPATNFGIGNTSIVAADFTLEAWVWIDSTIVSSRSDNLKRVSVYEYAADQASLPYPYYAGRMFIDGTTSTCGTGIGLQDDGWGTWSTAVSISNDAWHHLVWQRVGTTLYAYVDGTRYTLTTGWSSSAPMGYNSATNNIGGNVNLANHSYFKGYIDDLRLTPYAVYSGTSITPPITALPNNVTAPETFYLRLKRDPGGTAGVQLVDSPIITVNDTSISPTITANTTSISENNSVLFSITTSGVPDGTTLYWTMATTTGVALVGDFSDNTLSGSVVINSNAATVTRQWALDAKTEGRERWVLQLRTISTGGAIIATSPVVAVGDVSQGSPEALLVFPVSSPLIQWYINPQLTATGTYANTNLFDFSGVLDQVPPWQKWKSNRSAGSPSTQVIEYTRPGGGTRKYLRLPVYQNFTTHNGTNPVESFNGSAIASNQGYTMWSVIWQGSWNWTTIMRYLGSGPYNLNNSTENQPGGDNANIHQFQNAQQFFTIENHFPNPGDGSIPYYGSGHAPSYPNQYNRYILFCIVSLGHSPPGSTATAYMDLRTFDTQTNTVWGTPVVNYGASSGNWYINSTTTGRPSVIRDSYGSSGNIDIMEMGFANRTYTAAERASLMSWLVSTYT